MDIHVDISEPDDELSRLINGLTGKDTYGFEALLATQFVGTQHEVHIDTMSLKRSGQVDSETHKYEWIGEIKYGGASPGSENDPVDYAVDEYKRDEWDGPCPGGIHEHTDLHGIPCPGGQHDFLRPAKVLDGAYMEPFKHFLNGKVHHHGNA